MEIKFVITNNIYLFWQGVLVVYHNIGPPSFECQNCKAIMWYQERSDKSKSATNPTFSICCQEGKLLFPIFNEAPSPLKEFMEYNNPTSLRFK